MSTRFVHTKFECDGLMPCCSCFSTRTCSSTCHKVFTKCPTTWVSFYSSPRTRNSVSDSGAEELVGHSFFIQTAEKLVITCLRFQLQVSWCEGHGRWSFVRTKEVRICHCPVSWSLSLCSTKIRCWSVGGQMVPSKSVTDFASVARHSWIGHGTSANSWRATTSCFSA